MTDVEFARDEGLRVRKMMRIQAFFMKFAVIVGLVFGPLAPAPAQASIIDCLNALVPVGSALKLASEAVDPEFLQCSAHMSSGDPVFISTVGLMLGAGGAGAFDSEATCMQMTTGQIGKFIAGILTNMGALSAGLKALLGEAGYQALVAFAASEAASNIATETPLKSVFEYMTCGCTIFGKAKAAMEVATEYIGDVKQCAAFIEDIGGVIMSIVESGADAVGEFFGHPQDGPVDQLVTSFPQCGNWQLMQDTAVIYSNAIVETLKPRPYYTKVTTCTCAAPSQLEVKPVSDGLIAARCACNTPVNGTYDSGSKTCGCRQPDKLLNGACVACETETFSQTPDTISVASGVVTDGVCKPLARSCPAGQMPVRAKAGYYYECQPVCAADQFFVKLPGDLAQKGVCAACPANTVPDANALRLGQLQCNECPARTAAGAGDRQCGQLTCANGIDPNNPHACLPPCRLVGEGKNKRLVCDGNMSQIPSAQACPSGTVRVGASCIPEIHHKPEELIIQRETDRPRVKPDIARERNKDRNREKSPPRVTDRRAPASDDVLLGPARPQPQGPSLEELLNFGIGVGNALGRGNPGPEMTKPRSRERYPSAPTTEVPVYKHSKD